MIDTCDQTLSKESRLEATRNEMNLRCLCTVVNQVKKLISRNFGSTRISSRSYTYAFHGLERVSNVVSYTVLPNSVALLTPRKEYSWLPITRTSRYLWPKSIPPGFSSYIYCNFSVGNSNLSLIRSSCCFPSDHFYVILPSITRTMEFWALKTLKSRGKKSNGVRNIEFWVSHWRVVGMLKYISGGWCCLSQI